MYEQTQQYTAAIWQALQGNPALLAAVRHHGSGDLASCYPVSDFASSSIAAAALAIADLSGLLSGKQADVRVDRRLASMWFAWTLRPLGWQLPAAWDALAGDYQTRDGWIRLHTNAPHHRQAALQVLGKQAERRQLAQAVATWSAAELEQAIINAGGCAAEMHTVQAWQAHPQGRAVNREPLIHVAQTSPAAAPDWQMSAQRPLAGLRVLDLTRVLAGPVASRFLAGFGAQVLRIDPPDWDEPGVIPEVTVGKRCARLNLHAAADRAVFEGLLSQADILLHGYRASALDRLGYTVAQRQALSPGLIDVSLNAYGWSGPWQDRRGFDSLLQMSAGIAAAGMDWRGADKPVPLPVQALDHATGYMLAASAIRAVRQRLETGCGSLLHMSLARSAALLIDHADYSAQQPFQAETEADLAADVEATSWGPVRRLISPIHIDGTPLHWSLPARNLGTDSAAWWP